MRLVHPSQGVSYVIMGRGTSFIKFVGVGLGGWWRMK